MGSEDENKPENNMFIQPGGADWLLARVANLVELGVGLDVTLSAGGTVISGRIISVKSYFELVVESFGEPSDDNMAELHRSIVDSFKIFAEGPEGKQYAALDRPRRYLHLKDVVVVNGDGSTLPLNGALWRGRLQAVEWFTLGKSKSG